jgi:hypothetical protein
MNAFCRVVPVWMGSALIGACIAGMPIPGSFAQSNPAVAAVGEYKMAFLSRRRDESSAEEAARSTPEPGGTDFDGRWIFTSAGCPHTGSLPATIRNGKIIVRGGGGLVSPDGTLHSVGAGGGMTLTAVGQLSGNNGSGTFNRSDGCVGTWIAIKRQ